MSKPIFIKGFCDSDDEFFMNDSIAYCNGEKAILYEKNGHILCIDANYIENLKQGLLPDKIFNKLKSRMFVSDLKRKNNCCDYDINVAPEFFMIDLTNKCNMHCKYCLREVRKSNLSISRNVIEDICNYIIKYCNKYKLKNVTIQPWGGEPLIELESILLMKRLISGIDTNVHFSIETNAILLNEYIIDVLYENKIGLGISIDGYKELHDAQRIFPNGDGTHSIVEKNLLLAKQKYDFRLGTITTLTKINAPEIEDMLEYYAVVLGLTNVKFNFVHESMFSDCADLCLSKEEIAETEVRLLNKIVELNERGYLISEHNIKVKLKNLLLKKYSDICHSTGCSGGKKMIVFDMNGRIYPCELTDTIDENIGSIYDDIDLIDVVQNATKEKDFFLRKMSDKCQNCMWYIYCKGGCTVRAISIGKRPPEIDEIECSVNEAVYPALLQLILEKPIIVNKMVGEKIL